MEEQLKPKEENMLRASVAGQVLETISSLHYTGRIPEPTFKSSYGLSSPKISEFTPEEKEEILSIREDLLITHPRMNSSERKRKARSLFLQRKKSCL